MPAAWHALGDAMFGASSTTEWHLNYDTTAQWYAPVNACQAAVIFTAGQLPYAKVTVCGGWVSVEATADVGNQPDAASHASSPSSPSRGRSSGSFQFGGRSSACGGGSEQLPHWLMRAYSLNLPSLRAAAK